MPRPIRRFNAMLPTASAGAMAACARAGASTVTGRALAAWRAYGSAAVPSVAVRGR